MNSRNLRKEIYATICILGGLVLLRFTQLNLESDIMYLITSIVLFVCLMAVKWKWYLPTLDHKA
jgi:uncharacterized membrane protein YeiH